MRIQGLPVVLAALVFAVCVEAIDHDKVKPFTEPEPITISEKAGAHFKPILAIYAGCAPYPVVNAAGEISGGLKVTEGDSECTDPPAGSQMYGRAMWHNDRYAIMYAWYFPKGFWLEKADRRHDWTSAVVWIDNPALATPSILGLSVSISNTQYDMFTSVEDIIVNNDTHPTLERREAFHQPLALAPTALPVDSASQTLIMWDQLTDEARDALC